MYKVSVIIPVWNQETLVIRCLNSIPKREDIEIIVVNDASTDKTLKNLKKYKEKPIKIVDLKENMGVSNARNVGLEQATGKYILFVDSDDYVYPDVFLKIVDEYLFNDMYDMVFYDMENKLGNIYYSTPYTYKVRAGMFKFIKRSFIGDLRFTVGKHYAEDLEFTLKLYEKDPRMYFTEELMYFYNYPRAGSLCSLGERNGE